MTFLLRSAFWLSIVYAHMPLDSADTLRAVDQTQSAIVATAANVAKQKCAQDGASCRAILGAAAGMVLTPIVEQAVNAPVALTQGAGKAKSPRPSANSLSAADLTVPWRGRAVRSGA